jgi:putative ABC transport system permease protein
MFTLIIACLGMLGLVIYTTRRREKEISIRKVLGASVLNLTHLLSKEFVRLWMIAFLIAAPLAGFFMSRWLEEFGYRVTIEWWMFALGAGISTVAMLTTVTIQSVKTALRNPVRSLRGE